MRYFPVIIISGVFLLACNQSAPVSNSGGSKDSLPNVEQYFDYGVQGVQSAGIRMIPIKTPVGEFKVWTKRFGNNRIVVSAKLLRVLALVPLLAPPLPTLSPLRAWRSPVVPS